MLHTTYKLFMSSLTLECLGLFADCMAYGPFPSPPSHSVPCPLTVGPPIGGRYAKDGVGAESVEFLGQMLHGASRIVFLLMLILMGKGRFPSFHLAARP